MSNVHPALDKYLEKILPARSNTLAAMEAYAAKVDFPIIKPLAGRLLYQQALLLAANSKKSKIKVFELGSGYGYSAFWFSLALGAKGEIHLTDNNPDNLEQAKEYFKTGKLKSKFVYHTGDAIKSFKKSSGKFDIILSDIDKVDYPSVVRAAVPRLNKGGMLISDNLIWSGKVFGRNKDKATESLRKYTKMVYNHPKLFTTIIPLRDGVAISVKL